METKLIKELVRSKMHRCTLMLETIELRAKVAGIEQVNPGLRGEWKGQEIAFKQLLDILEA